MNPNWGNFELIISMQWYTAPLVEYIRSIFSISLLLKNNSNMTIFSLHNSQGDESMGAVIRELNN